MDRDRQAYQWVKVTVAIVCAALICIPAILTSWSLATQLLKPSGNTARQSGESRDVTVRLEDSAKKTAKAPATKLTDPFAFFADMPGKIESKIDDSFFARTAICGTLFDFQAKVLGQTLLNQYYIDKSFGWMQKVCDEPFRVSHAAETINRLTEAFESRGIEAVTVIAPCRVIQGVSALPYGITDYQNTLLDDLLGTLHGHVLDLRRQLDTYPYALNRLFYASDHHWTIETSQWAAFETVAYLASLGFEANAMASILDYGSYSHEIYPKRFLGSYGQNTSMNLTGIDDFVKIVPNFDTDFTLTQIKSGVEIQNRRGSFGDALVYSELIDDTDQNGISEEAYTAYLGYTNTEKRIVNHLLPHGKKLLVIGTSLSRPYAAFLSPMFEETRGIDAREGRFETDILSYIDEMKPDYIIMTFGSNSLIKADNAGFFLDILLQEDGL